MPLRDGHNLILSIKLNNATRFLINRFGWSVIFFSSVLLYIYSPNELNQKNNILMILTKAFAAGLKLLIIKEAGSIIS